MADILNCLCGSGLAYTACCEKYLNGSEQAETAQVLMRSRYSAYVAVQKDYLLRTWHESSRPSQLVLEQSDNLQWLGLTIIETERGEAEDKRGIVEFVASYTTSNGEQSLHERSYFVKEQGLWFYLSGEIKKVAHSSAGKTSRNAPCPCGSGKKFKRCCADKNA